VTPAIFAIHDLSSGRLIKIFEQSLETEFSSFAVCLPRRLADPLIAAALDWLITFSLSPINQQQSWSTALLAATFFFTALYCLRSANLLWGRVDFQSVLIWVEILGSFEEARINIGNQRLPQGRRRCRNERCHADVIKTNHFLRNSASNSARAAATASGSAGFGARGPPNSASKSLLALAVSLPTRW